MTLFSAGSSHICHLVASVSPVRRWHSALSFLPSDSLRLQHRSPSQCSRSNFVLDDCKSSYTEFLHNWFFCSLVSVYNLQKSTTLRHVHHSSQYPHFLYLLLSTLLTMTSWSSVSHPALVVGSSHIGHLVASVSNVKPTCRQVDEDDAKPVVDVEVEVDAVLDERPQFRPTADHRLHTPQTAYDQWCK